MTSVGTFDPDWVTENDNRPAWATPKSPLAIEALQICGRKYFRGQTKHQSEFALWEKIECKTIGASDECFLQREWIKSIFEWVRKMNIKGTVITFPVMIKMIADNDRRIDYLGKNENRLLKSRKENIPDFAKRVEISAATFERKLQEAEESDE